MAIALPSEKYKGDEKRRDFFANLSEHVRALPGVTAVGLAASVPLGSYEGWTSDLSVRGRAVDAAVMDIAHREVTTGYFTVMGVPLLRGRHFAPTDGPTSEPVVILNSAAAAFIFPNQDPIGQYVSFDRVPDSTSLWRRVVGVVGSERQRALASEAKIEVFEPFTQSPTGRSTLVMRTTGPSSTTANALRTAVSALDPGLAPLAIRAMEDYKAEALGRDRILASLFLTFAVMGGVLALIGVYGVIAQITQRRYQEIGIRVALGARSGEIRWMVVRQGLVMTSIGVVVGLLLALLAGRAIQQLLFGVSATDPATFIGMPLFLLATACLATLIPAFRATRRDPAGVLRSGR